jgi:hypothetical protein
VEWIEGMEEKTFALLFRPFLLAVDELKGNISILKCVCDKDNQPFEVLNVVGYIKVVFWS